MFTRYHLHDHLREIKIALAFGLASYGLLMLTPYPGEHRVGIVLVGYVCYFGARVLLSFIYYRIGRSTVFQLVAELQATGTGGDAIADSPASRAGRRIGIGVFEASSIGFAVALTTPIASYWGFPPLHAVLIWVGGAVSLAGLLLNLLVLLVARSLLNKEPSAPKDAPRTLGRLTGALGTGVLAIAMIIAVWTMSSMGIGPPSEIS